MQNEVRNFLALLKNKWKQGKLLCVGLDTKLEKIPPILRDRYDHTYDQILSFNQSIIDATAEYVCAFKPNRAFYDNVRPQGDLALADTIGYILSEYPDIPVILDQKRDDIGNTNKEYVKEIQNTEEALVFYPADTVTVHPYFGQVALKPFLDCVNKGAIVLCKTSNEGSGEFQNLRVEVEIKEVEELLGHSVGRTQRNKFGWAEINYKYLLVPLYQYVALRVSKVWNEHNNCALVVGATYPEELGNVRQLVGDGFPILVPGIGTQGGDLEAVLQNGLDSNNEGLIINASSGIIYASEGDNFAEAAGQKAKQLHEKILDHLSRREKS